MSIRLSKKHGVNPSLEQCFFCMEPKGLILFGRLRGEDKEAPRQIYLNKEPCDKCKGWMDKGVLLISVNEKLSDDMENPYRSGGWCVVSEDCIRRMFIPKERADDVLERRAAFVSDEAWDKVGLPRGGSNG